MTVLHDMSDTLKSAIATINKAYPDNPLRFASENVEIPRLSSGSLFLDWALGINKDGTSGWSMGRVIELYGYESSGKSLISMLTIAEAQRKGFQCAYLDIENSFDKDFATLLGVDTSKLLITTETGAEKVIDLACKIMQEYPDIKVIVFDSVASMIPKVELEASLEDQQMASVARVMSKGMRKLIHFNQNRAVLIFINQIRLNPGAGKYANPEYQPGGQALKFYSSIRAEIRRGEWLFDEEASGEEKKKKIGQTVKFKIVKNKTGVAQKEGYFKFMYEGAKLDLVDELVSLALLNDKISRSGAYYSFGVDHTFQGREKMEEALRTQPELFKELQEEVFGKEVKKDDK